MYKILIIIFLIFTYKHSLAKEISGIPRVIDGDTVHINSHKIRLEGIDAPEIKQYCKKPLLKFSAIIGFTINKDYPCGLISKKRLIEKIKKSKIVCYSTSKDRYRRYIATCYLKNLNLNKWMVRNGYAVAYLRYSKQYLTDENYAKLEKLGIWEGTFTLPEKWRKLN